MNNRSTSKKPTGKRLLKPKSPPATFDLTAIVKTVRAHRCLLIRLTREQFETVQEGRYRGRAFTMAVAPEAIKETRAPTICLMFSERLSLIDEVDDLADGHIGLLLRKRHLTTIERGLKIAQISALDPDTLSAVVKLLKNKRAATDLARRLSKADPVISLPPDMSAQLMRAIAERPRNHMALSRIAERIDDKRPSSAPRQLQADAIRTALEIFGLQADAEPFTLEIARPGGTELSRLWLHEDSVVEHDARQIPGFSLTDVSVTGRAQFRRRNEILEVYTANRRPLERVFGVDLIYHNLVRKNLVMVQYKMLNPHPNPRVPGVFPDWIYRPDSKLAVEISRMKAFSAGLPASPGDYRLNPGMFYLKFVRRDKIGSSAAITVALEHFEQLRTQPSNKGPRGSVRISYNSLSGSYLRDDGFFDLVRAGYIGSYASTTTVLLPLINSLVDGDRAVVLAIQKGVP